MYQPLIWSELRVPWQWQPVDIYKVTFSVLQDAYNNKEIELMHDFNDNLWWRRDFNETRELGL